MGDAGLKLWPEETLWNLIEGAAKSAGNKRFVIDPVSGVALTYDEFRQAALAFSNLLLRNGASAGDRVVLCLENGPELSVLIVGTWLAGMVAVPLPISMKDAELSESLKHASPRFLACRAEAIPNISSPFSDTSVPLELPFLACGTTLLFGAGESCPAGAETPQATPPAAVDAAVLLYTSGSTRNRKGALLSHESLLNSARNIVSACEVSEHDVTICTTPMAHNIGLLSGLIVPLMTGSSVVMPPVFRAEGFLDLLRRHRVTWLTSVPTVLQMLQNFSIDDGKRDLSLRVVRVAGGPLPIAFRRAFEGRFGVPVVFAYGMTEGGVITSNSLRFDRAGSVGKACARMEIQVVDEAGSPMRAGEVGEVRTRGASVFLGYMGNPEATRESLKDGWLYTGDLGFLDQDGYLFISGRKKEVLNIGGKKVAYREIEEAIELLPEVETAIVAGDSQTIAGERVIAFIKLRPGAALDPERVIRHCDERLADYKVPRRVIQVSGFPLSDSGKILRNRLLELHGLKPPIWESASPTTGRTGGEDS